MKIGTKLSGGFLLMTLLIVIAGGAGIYGVSQLAKILTFISGPAWDAADGAMEGSIGIGKQMIALERMVGDGSIQSRGDMFTSHNRLLDEGKQMTDESLGRVRESGLIPDALMKSLDEKLRAFVAAREALLQSKGDKESYLNYTRMADTLLIEITQVEEVGDSQVEGKAKGIESLVYGEYQTLGFVIFLGIFCTLVAGYLTRRFIVNPLNKAVDYTKNIAEGKLSGELLIPSNDELGLLAQSLETMVEGLRKAEVSKVRMAQISTMVEQATLNMMLCDSDLKVVYLNAASSQALKAVEELLPCRVEEIVGQSIDVFHKNPERIRKILNNPLNLPHSAEIRLGDLALEFTVGAVMSEAGESIGFSVMWSDVTAHKNAQEEVERMIVSASEGKLDERIHTESLEGFYKTFACGINRMLDSIKAPLDEAQEVLVALSNGDLRCEMIGDYQGTFGNIKENLNGMIDKLSETLSAVYTASETVTLGVTEISSGNDDLSQRTSEQASALQQTSASMEQMAATVKQNADNAQQASQLAIAAHGIAEKGGQVTAQTIVAMAEVNKSSRKIVDIISVIDEIAFQTNLLALNAAVEAARAGEHGRGFAVVAAEVRNLAQRSGSAAKEIKSLINESVQQVTKSSDLLNESGKTLDKIVKSVKQVTDVIAEISTASHEQSIGISEVNRAIIEIDETTQQNAALVEEAASSSHGINSQSEELLRQVSFFTFAHAGDNPENRSQRSPKGNRQKHTKLEVKVPAVGRPESLHSMPPITDWSENSSRRGKAHKPEHKPVVDDFTEF